MRRLPQSLCFFLACAALVPSAFAGKHYPVRMPDKVLEASSVYLDCDCRKEMKAALPNALPEFLDWGRYRLAPDRKHADLIFYYSMNDYLGDYLTRDGPDKRPADVDFTILTVIDARTGEALWTDSRRWGYMLVSRASKDLMHELRVQVAEQIKRWTLDDILSCNTSSVYALFAHLTPEQALEESGFTVGKVPDDPSRLTLSSPAAPAFCQHAELILNPQNQIVGFEVLPTKAESLELSDVIQDADQFSFSGGKTTTSDKVYFIAQSKDKKISIQFDMNGTRSILSRVTYFYQPLPN